MNALKISQQKKLEKKFFQTFLMSQFRKSSTQNQLKVIFSNLKLFNSYEYQENAQA